MNTKPIPDCPGYLASDCGKIFSTVKLGRWQKDIRRITEDVTRDGYPSVRVYRNGRRVRRPVHTLVAAAWIAKPIGTTLIRHLNDDKANNAISNLAWGTHADNVADAVRNGRTTKGKKHSKVDTHCMSGHEFTPENTYTHNEKRACRTCRARRVREWGIRNHKRKTDSMPKGRNASFSGAEAGNACGPERGKLRGEKLGVPK